MVIIKIEYDNSSSNFIVNLDDDSEYLLTYEQVEELKLSEGNIIDLEIYKKIYDFSSYNTNKTLAFNYASKRIISTYQLERYLKRKDVSSEIIDRIISEFVKIGLIDNTTFIIDYIEYKKEINKMSRRMIRYQLKGLGFTDSFIDKHMSNYTEEDEYEIAVDLFNSRYGQSSLDDYKEKNKAYQYFYRKGFNSDTINRVFNKVGI